LLCIFRCLGGLKHALKSATKHTAGTLSASLETLSVQQEMITRLTMKTIVILFLSFLCAIPSFSQELNEIKIKMEWAHSPSSYEIIYEKDRKNNLSSKRILINGLKKKLPHRFLIENHLIKKFHDWKDSEKYNFSLSDINLSHIEIISNNFNYNLVNKLDENLIIYIDTFNFCQNNILGKSMISVGYYYQILFSYNKGEIVEYKFSSNDFHQNTFNLRNYIYLSSLLRNNLPSELPNSDFFSSNSLIQTIYLYLKTIECEDYYYKKYMEENPDLSTKERRMRIGWDFKLYLKEKNIID
jgi:hypothetical protein